MGGWVGGWVSESLSECMGRWADRLLCGWVSGRVGLGG